MRLNHSGEAYFPEQWELDASATKSPVKLRGAPLALLPKSPAKAGGDESAGGSSDEEDGGGTAKDAMPSPTRGGGRGIFHGWRGRFGWRRNHANDGAAEDTVESVESAAGDGDDEEKGLRANGNGEGQGDGGEGSSAPTEAEAQARLSEVSVEAHPLTDSEAPSSHTNGMCAPVHQLFPPLEHEARAAAAAAVAESTGKAGSDEERAGSGASGDERVFDGVEAMPSHGLDPSHAEQDAVEMTAAAAAATVISTDGDSTTIKPSPPRQNGHLEVRVQCRARYRFRRRRLQLLTFPTRRLGHSGRCSPRVWWVVSGA